jgi:hypothetical protein
MPAAVIDYDVLAKQHGGIPLLDYEALAQQFGGIALEEKPVHHTSNDIEELRASAERQSPKVGDAVARATEAVANAKVEAVRDSKDSDRIADKAERQGVQPSQVGDVLAAKVTVPDQASAEKVLANLHQEMPVEAANGKVTGDPQKNAVRQTQAIISTNAPAGEPVKKAEVILQTPEMAKATDQTHDDYRKAQELRSQGKEAEAAALEKKIASTHDKAEREAQLRNQPATKDQIAALAAKLNTSATPRPPDNLKNQDVEVRDAKTGEWKPGTVVADYLTGGNDGIRRLRGVYADGSKFDNVKAADVRKAQASPAISPAPGHHADVGVDFDGTLFTQTEDGSIGKPIPARIQSVKDLLAQGKTVQIETRRVQGRPEEVKKIQDALASAGLPRLPVTDQKTAKILFDNEAHHAPTDANTPLTKSNNSRKK